MVDLDHFRYYVGNPSAWDHYDDKMSDRMREAADMIDELARGIDGSVRVAAEALKEVERLRVVLESLTKDPPASLAREPDEDWEVIVKMRAIARGALEGAATGERQ